MLHSTKSKSFRQLIFHYLQNVFAVRIWPAVPSLEIGFSGLMKALRIVVWRPLI